MPRKSGQKYVIPGGEGRAKRRAKRVADLIRNEISSFLLRKVSDPGVDGITITHATLTDDLRLARVYFTVLGGEDRQRVAAAGLARAKGFIRNHIAQELDLRFVPELDFRFDRAVAAGEKLDQLFEEIAADNEEASGKDR